MAVLGLGLMGGSLARSLSRSGVADRVGGWSPEPGEREAAVEAGAVALTGDDWRDVVADADVVVLAVPLGPAVELLSEVAAAAPETATLTDVVSLKAPMAEAASSAGIAERWVGSHPMTGGESSGFEACRADLYRGARVWTVPGPATQGHRARVDRLWRGVGAEPREIEAEAHDRMMGLVSHLPQLVSNVLASVLEREGAEPSSLGPGGRDMTRLAASSPEMWLDLLAYAPSELVAGLRAVGREADRLALLVDNGDLDEVSALMRRTRAWREGP